MAKLTTFTCDVCGDMHTEEVEGEGAKGWGQFLGIKLNGVDNPILCPPHKERVANLINMMADEEKG